MSEAKKDTVAQSVQTALVICVVLLVLYFTVGFFWKLIVWALGIIILLILLLNRKIFISLFKRIRSIYNSNQVLGILAGVGALLASPLLIIYLFSKTLWDFRNSPVAKKVTKNKQIENLDFEEVDDAKENKELLLEQRRKALEKLKKEGYDDDSKIF